MKVKKTDSVDFLGRNPYWLGDIILWSIKKDTSLIQMVLSNILLNARRSNLNMGVSYTADDDNTLWHRFLRVYCTDYFPDSHFLDSRNLNTTIRTVTYTTMNYIAIMNWAFITLVRKHDLKQL